MSSVIEEKSTEDSFINKVNYVSLEDRVRDFISYINSGSYTMYSAIKRLSSLEYEIRMMLEYFEDNKSEIISDVQNIKKCLDVLVPKCKDVVIVNIVSEIIENINSWISVRGVA